MDTQRHHDCSPATPRIAARYVQRIGAALGLTAIALLAWLFVGCGLGGDSAGAAVIDTGNGGNYKPGEVRDRRTTTPFR